MASIVWIVGVINAMNFIDGMDSLATVVALTILTYLHIVLGELAPKSLALLFPESVSMWTAGPLIVFAKIFTPFIHFLNGSANLILKAVGLRAPREAEVIDFASLLEKSLATRRKGNGGALRVTIHTLSSSGIVSVKRANCVSTGSLTAPGRSGAPPPGEDAASSA